MKLKLKLPLAFALAMGLLFFGAMFGIVKLNGSLGLYEHEVLGAVAAYKKVAQADGHFATAVQEWKNVLLRGKEPKDQSRYWTAHLKEMKAVRDELAALEQMSLDADARATLGQLSGAVAGLSDAYQKAFEAFKAADADPVAGDKLARGKDRDASALMIEPIFLS